MNEATTTCFTSGREISHHPPCWKPAAAAAMCRKAGEDHEQQPDVEAREPQERRAGDVESGRGRHGVQVGVVLRLLDLAVGGDGADQVAPVRTLGVLGAVERAWPSFLSVSKYCRMPLCPGLHGP